MVTTTTPLREQMCRALRIRNMSSRTESTYIHMVARFAAHLRRSADRLGRPHVEEYLLFIRDVKNVSYCSWHQCVCALRFFYRHVLDRPELVQRIPFGHRERHLPVVLSVDEVLAFLTGIRSLRDRVIITVLSTRPAFGSARSAALASTTSTRSHASAHPSGQGP